MAFSSFRTHNYTNVANTGYDEGFNYASNPIRVPPKDDQQHHLCELNDPSARSSHHRPSLKPLGVPTVKKRLHNSHVLAAVVSLISLALAITAVANGKMSWLLGQKNYQLIVVGFLLSIMNLCLGSTAPTLFLHVEARYGSSTLQNYDGILCNRVLGSRLDALWRLILGLMTILPLGLSVAYKTFTGGHSMLAVNSADYIGNTSYYGMFAPPGLQSLGKQTGTSLFFNATLPFLVAASPVYGTEPPIPLDTQVYGFNILLLDNKTTAALDIPQPAYISTVQSLLAPGESWGITARIAGTVAKFNYSKTTESDAMNSTFMRRCEEARASSGAYTAMQMLTENCFALLSSQSPDQSFQYLGFPPFPNDHTLPGYPSCSTFSHYAQLYDITRRPCTGSWIITRGGFRLVSGRCAETTLPPEKQLIITGVTGTFFGYFYMSSLVEFLGPFGTSSRNGSDWEHSFMATGVAAMLWSRITVMYGAANLAETHDAPDWTSSNNTNFTLGDVGLMYPVNDIVEYTRPTLRKSGLLYFTLAIQPLLVLVSITSIAYILKSTPLDKDFGFISVLSGIDRESLDVVNGASLSGNLAAKVKLIMRPMRNSQGDRIRYFVMPSSSTITPTVRNGRLAPNTIYH
ncbi:MAG: hypothetical protein L6R40_001212 [Gallowayella cf. fulva]|nr:MAG: hypothetical protein L6R40_001212 [Xanthomendoza cf. fulva]